MENYPSNSRKQSKDEKEEPKKIEKVTSGDVVRRKKPLGKRFTETFVGGDAKSVWGYIVFDVLIPASKDMVSDAVSQGVERMLFGEARSRRVGSRGGNGHVNYSSRSSIISRREETRGISRRARVQHDFDEIVLSSRAEADEVIDRLFDLVSKYDSATVADLYELVGITGNYTDDKWGWTDIRGAGSSRVKGGYLLDLPRPEPLD